VESAPPLPFGWCPWALHHSVPSDLLCQPVPAAVPHDKFVKKHQLALWPIEPVIVGIRDGHSSLKPLGKSEKECEKEQINVE